MELRHIAAAAIPVDTQTTGRERAVLQNLHFELERLTKEKMDTLSVKRIDLSENLLIYTHFRDLAPIFGMQQLYDFVGDIVYHERVAYDVLDKPWLYTLEYIYNALMCYPEPSESAYHCTLSIYHGWRRFVLEAREYVDCLRAHLPDVTRAIEDYFDNAREYISTSGPVTIHDFLHHAPQYMEKQKRYSEAMDDALDTRTALNNLKHVLSCPEL